MAHLWVKSEPFCFGVLPVNPHHKLTPKALKRIILYAKNKKDLGYPKLRYSVWRHIACTKLQLSEEMAWMFYCIYHSLTKMRAEDRIQWDKEFARLSWPSRDQLKSMAVVDTMKFVLLLFIQLINRTTVRSSSVSTLSTEEWPTQARNLEWAEGRNMHRDKKLVDEQRFLQFIVTHLEDILETLSSELKSNGEAVVPSEAVAALGFLLEGSVDDNKSVSSLLELVNLHSGQCGYSAADKTYRVNSLVNWLRTKLGTNPFGISSCLMSGRRLSWPTMRKDKQGKHANLQNGRIATNDHYAPKGKKVIIMSHLDSQVVCRSHRSIRGFHVQLYRCQSSVVYLLSPVRFVTIYKCHHCTIVLGAVASCIYVSMCQNVTIIAATRRIWINNTTSSDFYLLTPTHPILAGNKNDSLTLAPYPTFYPLLEEHLAEVGLSAAPNFWELPLCISSSGCIEESQCWRIMSPEEFFTFNIPFNMEGNTSTIPGGLPPVYTQVLKERDRLTEIWHRTVRDAQLAPQQQAQLHDLVQSRFQLWLVSSGYQQELDMLANLMKGRPDTKD